MKAFLTTAATLSCLLTAAVPAATAQTVRETLMEMDSNGDKVLQFTEIETFKGDLFDQFDANGNGVADPDEVATLRKRSADMRGRKAIGMNPKDADTNGDGVLTRAEFVEYIPQRTLSADSNGDGGLSVDEIKSLR